MYSRTSVLGRLSHHLRLLMKRSVYIPLNRLYIDIIFSMYELQKFCVYKMPAAASNVIKLRTAKVAQETDLARYPADIFPAIRLSC